MTQSEWDTALIVGFFRWPGTPMWMMHGVKPDIVSALRRAPRDMHHKEMSVCRFVCFSMPKLANVLWRCTLADTPKIVNALSKSKIDSATRNSLDERDNRERYKTAREYQAARLADRGHALNLEANARRAWNICK